MARLPRGIEIGPKLGREAGRVLSAEALQFVAELHRGGGTVRELLKANRAERQVERDKGGLPDFKPETSAIRCGRWTAAALPRDLLDLRAGIVTEVSRKPLLAGLNCGARLCLADLSEFTSPAWDRLIDGQGNLMDRWTSAMEHVDKATGRRISLSQRLATLMVQPRSIMADEPRVKCDGTPIAAGLFDAGLYLFHNAKVALAKASGPYLQLIDVASQHEARAWNDILLQAQSLLGLPTGSIRVHLRIDSLAAAFEMDEIIHELREHAAGMSPGGQRYGFDIIRSFAAQKARIIGGDGPPDGALRDLVIRTAHRRGLLALAPMSRSDARAQAEQAVRSGFDGMWTSHPEHVAAALKVFDGDMPTANQIYVSRDEVTVGASEILETGKDARSEIRVRQNIDAALLVLEAWLGGGGGLSVDGAIEDLASADFRRAQLWQWLRHGVKLDGTKKFNAGMFEAHLAQGLNELKSRDGRFKEAATLLKALVTATDLPPDIFALAWKKLP